MYFFKLYPHYRVGYTVTVKLLDADGCTRFYPLRSFGERQGDAIDFQLYDCPKMSEAQIRALAWKYDGRPYKRVESPDTGMVRFIHLDESECFYYNEKAAREYTPSRGKFIF